MKKVGILGGTFSPPHIGHIAMARAVLENLRLDEIVFMPCGDPPHKDLVWNAKLRLEMTKAITKDFDSFSVSDFEIKNQGKSYTAKTLLHLKEQNQDTIYYFIVGADSLCYMDEWMTPERIFDNAEIAVIGRKGYTNKEVEDYSIFLKDKYDAKIHRIDMDRVDVSSSMLRQMLKQNKDISPYTTQAVLEIIKEHFNEYR